MLMQEMAWRMGVLGRDALGRLQPQYARRAATSMPTKPETLPGSKRRHGVRTRNIVVVAVLAAALALSGGVAEADRHVTTLVAFDPEAGEFPEGVALDEAGTIYVSLVAPIQQIRTIDRSGAQSVLADFDVPGFGPAGLAVGPEGTLYAAVATFEQSTRGVYRVGADGTTERLSGTEAILFPNDVTVDRHGNVYATDSIGGAVWPIPPGGSAELWVQHPLLEGTGEGGQPFPVGANGIDLYRNHVVVANSERGLLAVIRVQEDGSAGTPHVLAESPALFGADGVVIDVHRGAGRVYVSSFLQSTVSCVRGDGVDHDTGHRGRRLEPAGNHGPRRRQGWGKDPLGGQLLPVLSGAHPVGAEDPVG